MNRAKNSCPFTVRPGAPRPAAPARRARSRAVLAATAALAACLAPAVGAQPPPIPLQEVAPGMTGYGLTVFAGARIDTFGVTVIGVQHNVRPQGSVILVEVAGHGLELSSIAQGMSGSPVFLQGRLAGALAFGWSGALKPIAGVTPAHEILALPTAAEPLAATQEGMGAAPIFGQDLLAGSAPGGLAAAILGAAQVPDARAGSATALAGLAGWPDPAEVILPLLRRGLRTGAEFLPEPGGWILQTAGGPQGAPRKAALGAAEVAATDPLAALRPGSACAVPLVLGDAALGAIGTVTWVQGRDVFMMGHPFLQRGPVDLPLATADVLGVLPSRQMSFKMGTVGRPVGTVHHDQRAGLSGTLGPVPALVPVTVRVTGAGQPAGGRDFSFQVVQDRQLTPVLVFWTLYNALLAEGDDASRQTVRYDIRTEWDGPAALAPGLRLQGLAAGPGGVQGLAPQLMAPLALLLDQSWQPVRLREVRADLQVSRPMAAATIVGLAGPRVAAAGGGPLPFRVDCAPLEGPRRTVELTLTLPPHLRPGTYRVAAASAAEFFALEAQRLGGQRQPADLQALVKLLQEERAGDTLVVALVAPGGGLVVQGRELADLPGSVGRTLRNAGPQAQATLADVLVRASTATPWLLDGDAIATLEIQAGGEPRTEVKRP